MLSDYKSRPTVYLSRVHEMNGAPNLMPPRPTNFQGAIKKLNFIGRDWK